MQKFFSKNRKTIKKSISIMLLGLVLFSSLSFPVYAQQTSTSTAPANEPGFFERATSAVVKGAIAPLLQGLTTPAIIILNLLLYLIRVILSFMLSLVAELLNYAFDLNVSVNPADWNVVRTGWSISRDIVNSLFILIVLWIAFTIILGAEKYGGKQLLAKVIMLALVINFSLVMVTAVFGFSNAFANIFAKQVPKDIAGFIVNALKTQSVTGGEVGLVGSIAGGFAQAENEEKTRIAFSGKREGWGIKNTLLASLGMNPAVAAGEPTGEEEAIAKSAGSLGGIRSALMDSLLANPPNWFASNVRDMISLVAANIYLVLTITVILVGAVALLLRILWMIILSIVAPLALLARVLPIGQAQGYFKQWSSNLLRWAFFAPGFYFLFYLSLLMIQTFDKAGGGQGSNAIAYIDLNRLVQLLLSLGFLVFAVKFAKQTGGALADAAIGAASKVGALATGVATGGATLAAGALARGAAPQIGKVVQGISGVPLLGTVAAPATRRVAAYVEEQQKVVEKKRDKIKNESDDMLIQRAKTQFLAQDRIAAVLELISREGGAAKLKGEGFDFKQAAELAKKYGQKTSDNIRNAEFDTTPKKKYDGVANEMVVREALDKNAKAFDRIAAVLELMKNRPGQLNKAVGQGLDMGEIVRLATGFGNKPVETILQSRLDLTSPALGPDLVLEKIAAKIKPDDGDKIDWSSMFSSMTAAVNQGRMSATDMNTTLRRIMEQLMISGGSTDRFGKILSGLAGQSKEARNAVNVQIQNILNDQNFWNNMQQTDEELLKRYLRQLVTNPSKAVTALNVPDSLRTMAVNLGLYRRGGGGRRTPPTGGGTPPAGSGPTP